jgi:hypothetical protein
LFEEIEDLISTMSMHNFGVWSSRVPEDDEGLGIMLIVYNFVFTLGV